MRGRETKGRQAARRALALLPVALATLALAASASAQGEGTEQTRAGYVSAAERVCKGDTARTKRILRGAQKRINQDRLVPAGHQFAHVSRTFGAAIGQLKRIPRPPADRARLESWFKLLGLVRMRLGILGRSLKAGHKFQSNYAVINVERAANNANNIVFPLGFKYCRFTRARFG